MSSNLLLQDPDFTTRLINLPMVQFFNSGSPFAGLGMDELLRSPCVLSCLVRKSLGLLVDHSRQATQWPSVPNLQNLPLVRRNCPPFTWEPEGKFQKPADLDAASVAIATIATDKFYAVGAAGLARSIKQKSGMQDGTRLICIVPRSIDSESSQLLAAEGWEVLMAESFDPQEFPQLFQELENPNYQYCCLKLHLWDLQQHCGRLQRVLYIDSDALVVGDLQKVLYAAETDPPNGGVSMAPDYDWRTGLSLRCNEVASMKKVSTAMSLDSTVAETLGIPKSKVLSAESSEGAEGQLMLSKSSYGKSVVASAFKPDTYCNAGVLLLRPSVQVYKTLMDVLRTFQHQGLAEQDLLHEVFTVRGLTKVMEEAYNAQKWISVCAPDLWASYDLKIIHYNNKKPWSLSEQSVKKCFDAENERCAALVELWHDIFGSL